MKTPRRFSYCSGVAATRMVAPRPASTRNHLSPATMAVAGPAWFASGRGNPVPRRITARLSNKFVIDDLRPRLHRVARVAQGAARHPLARHFVSLLHADLSARGVEQVGGAEVNAADVGGVVVDDADELHIVARPDPDLFVELALQSFQQCLSGIDVTTDSQRQLVMQPRLGLLGRAGEHEIIIIISYDDIWNDLPILRRDLRDLPIDEEMFRSDDVEYRSGVIANQARCEVRLQLDRPHDHDLFAHRSAASTSSCSKPLVEIAEPPSARGCPSNVVKRPPASSTMICTAAMSHQATCGSTAISIAPSATSM